MVPLWHIQSTGMISDEKLILQKKFKFINEVVLAKIYINRKI
jgi:hypothetical protein